MSKAKPEIFLHGKKKKKKRSKKPQVCSQGEPDRVRDRGTPFSTCAVPFPAGAPEVPEWPISPFRDSAEVLSSAFCDSRAGWEDAADLTAVK